MDSGARGGGTTRLPPPSTRNAPGQTGYCVGAVPQPGHCGQKKKIFPPGHKTVITQSSNPRPVTIQTELP